MMSKEKIDEITRFNLLDVITLVYELQLNAVCAQEFTTKLYALAQQWVDRSCIREIHVKQLIGLSTMVKNLPLQYKGMLAHAYDNISLTNPTNIPAFFLVLVRFTSPGLPGLLSTIDQSIETLAKEVCPEARNFFGDLFTTIHAGGGSLNQDDTLKSLAVKDGKDASPDDHITVLNHVLVEDKNSVVFDQLVGQLLKVAQVTFQPSSSASGDGLAGGPDNVFYRKALSTEILRALTPVNGVRAYLMHGVWRTEWDHENSHADPRFLEAAKKLAPYVIEGPVEPFYRDVWHVS
nr:hypothetical protein [Sulfobacillus thermosulfidooxidans]